MSHNRILFVDDDVLNQWLVTDSLDSLGFSVTGLCRGIDAYRILNDGYEFDLLLTDFHMPDGTSGFELADHWRRVQPGRPILYTSIYPQIALGRLRSDEGFIRKHADTPTLLGVINALLYDTYGMVNPIAAPRLHYIH